MKKIDILTWNRREQFEMFSQMEYPFISVTMPVEVTKVKVYSKKAGLSFYHMMVWLCAKAANDVPEFRMRAQNGEVFEYDSAAPSFTTLKKGSESFIIVTVPWAEEPAEFCRLAVEQSERQTTMIVEETQSDALYYISCTPWFDFTSATNPHSLDRDDTIPRFTWGKYYEENGRLMLHLAVEVNYRMLDGYHIGRFKLNLDREIAALE